MAPSSAQSSAPSLTPTSVSAFVSSRSASTIASTCLTTLAAGITLLAAQSEASAAFVNYSVVATCFTNSGQNLVRYEVFANFNGATDSVLNVFNFQALGGWAGHVDAACGFWHKDNNDTSPGVTEPRVWHLGSTIDRQRDHQSPVRLVPPHRWKSSCGEHHDRGPVLHRGWQ